MAAMLRHGLKCLWPSEIANHFSCEYKVHLNRLHLKVQEKLPSLELGEVVTPLLSGQAARITSEEIERFIRWQNARHV